MICGRVRCPQRAARKRQGGLSAARRLGEPSVTNGAVRTPLPYPKKAGPAVLSGPFLIEPSIQEQVYARASPEYAPDSMDAMDAPTLAQKLGTTTHLSPLLRKARRLGLDAVGLERLAVRRGCDYYSGGEEISPTSVSESQFSNEELAVALLNPALRYDPQTLRLGAAMLGAEGNSAETIARLARMERCEAMVRYVAEAGRRFEPHNPFWSVLLSLIPSGPPPKSSVVPHPTRFVAMTGITRRGAETVTEWIRPKVPVPSHG